jgi:hypothetical protein
MWHTSSGFNYGSPKNSTLNFRIKTAAAPSIHDTRIKTESESAPSALSLLRSRVLDKKSINLEKGRQMADQQAERYNSTSLISRLHERIVKSLRHMPKEIVNFMNINHYQFELVPTGDPLTVRKLLNEWEFELIAALQGIEASIVSKVFHGEEYNLK